MADKINYVPTVIRWTENGKVQQRTMKIEEGFTFDFEQSKKYDYKPKQYNSPGKVPVLNLSKEDAYNILGLSHANENGYTNSKGEKVYVLDHKDLEAAKKASQSNIEDNLTNQHVSWAGYGARVKDVSVTTNGGLSIIHNGTNAHGNKEEYQISIFYKK